MQLTPVAFLDDDTRKQKIKIHGIEVAGTRDKLPELVRRTGAKCVLIAMPSAPKQTISEIVEQCRPFKLDLKILPPLSERIGGGAARRIRDVRVEDLLGRHPVNLNTTRGRQSFQAALC